MTNISVSWLARVKGMRLSHDTNGQTKRSCMTGILFWLATLLTPFPSLDESSLGGGYWIF